MKLSSKLIIVIITLSFGFAVRVSWAGPEDCPALDGLDADEDCVIGANDQCYETPGLVEVDGCPDNDGDNIREFVEAYRPSTSGMGGGMGDNSPIESPYVELTVDRCPGVVGIGIDLGLTNGRDSNTTPSVPSNIANGCADWNCDGTVDADEWDYAIYYPNRYPAIFTKLPPEKRIIVCPKSYTAGEEKNENGFTTYTSEYQCWWKKRRDVNGIVTSGYIEDNDCDGIEDAPPGTEPGGYFFDNCTDQPGSRRWDTTSGKKFGCPEDRDYDGIDDEFDRCPGLGGWSGENRTREENKEHNNQEGFANNVTNGCPLPEVCDTTERDSDGDCIITGQDRCPRTPGFLSLHGCPDNNFDGEADAQLMAVLRIDFSAFIEAARRRAAEEAASAAREEEEASDPEPSPDPTPPPTPRRETPAPEPRTPSTTTPPTSTTTTQPTNFYREGELDTSDEENTVRTDDTNGDASNESYGGCSLVDGTAKSGGLSLIFLALSLMPMVFFRGVRRDK